MNAKVAWGGSSRMASQNWEDWRYDFRKMKGNNWKLSDTYPFNPLDVPAPPEYIH